MSDREATERIISLLAGLILLGAVATALLNFFENFISEGLLTRIIDYFLAHIWPIWKIVAVITSILAFIGIVYNFWKLRGIEIEEKKIYNPVSETSLVSESRELKDGNEKWNKVLEYMNSSNDSDWRLAVMEADVMLEDLLRNLGYQGDSTGEMLKSVDKNNFLTLDDAWEAHKVRNDIAHSGINFQLNERETKRVLALFEKVFKEFNVI